MASQTVTMAAEPRSELGSRQNKRLRSAGLIPAVIYGHREAVVPIKLPKKELTNHLSRGTHVLDLTFDGKSEKVLVKDIQFDHLGMEILHVDFARVRLDEKVEVTVPLELKGTPKGESDGGVLQQIINELEIECLVTEIPDLIRHNVAEMALDDVLHIKDLKLPEGVRCLQDEDLIVATVKEVQEEATTEAVEAESNEPEVIGRKPEEGEAEEGAEAAK